MERKWKARVSARALKHAPSEVAPRTGYTHWLDELLRPNSFEQRRAWLSSAVAPSPCAGVRRLPYDVPLPEFDRGSLSRLMRLRSLPPGEREATSTRGGP
jgi:hypothetical protein